MKQEPVMHIGDYTLVLTSTACPEQYDVYDKADCVGQARPEESKAVGYLRLRHGMFRAYCPFGGETVYSAPVGDEDDYDCGYFCQEDRAKHLPLAIQAIDEYRKDKLSEKRSN